METNKQSNINPENSNSDPGFKKKTVESPILGLDLRTRIGQTTPIAVAPVNGKGFKNFYQSNKVYFWAIGLGVLAIIILSFFLFRKQPKSVLKEANIDMTIDAPDSVPSGDDIVYKFKVQNNDSHTLTNLQLELIYGDNESYVLSTPNSDNLSHTLFAVPDLLSGQNAVVIVKAKASGNVNDVVHLTERLHYKYQNYNLSFIKEQTRDVRLSASNITFQLDGPTNTGNGQLVTYQLNYKNNSDQDIKGARVSVTFPDGFAAAQSVPSADLGNNTWNISVLPPGKGGNIQIMGSYSADAGANKTLQAQFLILSPTGDYFVQNSASINTTLSSLPLSVTQTVESNSNSDGIVNPGDFLNFRIHYQNNANVVAKGVNVVVSLDPKALDLSSLRAEGGQVTSSTILWNASTVSALESVAPNESGDLSFGVQVKNPVSRDSSKNLTVISSVKIKSNEYETYFSGADISLKISSPAAISSNLTYSSGSLPPQVGKSTVYDIKLSLTNATNDFSDGVLTAFIPLGPGGFVSGSVTPTESSKTQFDPSTGKLTWNFSNLPAHSGQFSQSRSLEFKIMLNPSQAQAGQGVTLVKNIQANATDTFTGKPVSLSIDNIDTTQVTGQQGYSNGQVVP